MRADSGFFDKALLAFLETRAIPYIVVARMTQEIKRRLHTIPHWQELEGGAYAVASFQAKLSGWDQYRRFVVARERVREEKAAVGRKLLDVPGCTFRVRVTNRSEDALESHDHSSPPSRFRPQDSSHLPRLPHDQHRLVRRWPGDPV